jgi:sec-independent protein translocase protein TatA
MNTMFAGMIGGWELILILSVVLILFGAKKLPELAKGLGTGIKEFKKATRDVNDELQKAIEDDPVPPPPRKLPPVNTETVANTEIASTPASSSSHPKA